MRITLFVNGHERSFSEDALTKIVSEYLSTKESTDEKEKNRIEGKWISVNFTEINEDLFKHARGNQRQEETRRTINEAIAIAKKNEKYRNFEIQIPEKRWKAKSFREMKDFAKRQNSRVANWIEVALWWATQIKTENDWHRMCDVEEDAEWYKVVEWKNTLAYIGNCTSDGGRVPMTEVFECGYLNRIQICDSVPILVKQK